MVPSRGPSLGEVIINAHKTIQGSHCVALGLRTFETELRERRDQGEWESLGGLQGEGAGFGEM